MSTGIASPVANAEVTLADETAPSIDTITSATSDGDSLGVGDTIIYSNFQKIWEEMVSCPYASNGASYLKPSDATTLRVIMRLDQKI